MAFSEIVRPSGFATVGMTSGWFHELKRRLEAEANKEAMAIGNGSCVNDLEQSAEVVAMMYRERVGFLMGLKRAVEIAGNVDAGREND